jgi:ABC-type Fe3+ transport system substrate-binding protein
MRGLEAFLLGVIAALACSSARTASALDAQTLASAKKEGSVLWYTTQIPNPLVLSVKAAFEKKYGIKLDFVRSNSTQIALRVLNEARAGRPQADVFDGATTAEAIKSEGLALKWLPDDVESFPREYVDPQGYWVATNFYLITAAYNTKLVSPADAPRTWSDLLSPRWKGRMIWANTPSVSAGPGFVGVASKELGAARADSFLQKLAAQRITEIGASARMVIDQVITGEFAIGLQIFPEHAIEGAARGAPIAWIPMRPAMSAIVSTTGIVAHSPHPNAAKVLLDFLVSPEGQTLYRDAFYIPANPKILPKDPAFRRGSYEAVFLTPAEAAYDMETWVHTYNRLFR